MNIIDKLILLTFPFMEVGFVLFGIPLRIGELTLFLSFLRILNSSKILKITKLNKIGLSIVVLLIFNLVLTVSVNFFSATDNTFYIKYILRNFIYIFILISFLILPIKYNYIKAESFIRYVLYLVSIFYFIEFIDYYIINFNWSNLVFVSRQEKFIFNNFIIRFAGQSSEPAYIIPLLSIPLMYGLFKKKFQYSVISVIYMLLPFSSFGYVIIIFSIVFFLVKVDDVELKKKVESFLIKSLVFIPVIGLIFFNKVKDVIFYNWEKLQTYFGLSNVQEWSASQRTGHIELAINLFKDSSFFRMLVGNGTGYYSKMSKKFTEYYIDDAEEAHNLYVSTLTDRGIIGLIILLLLFYFINRIKIPKNITGDLQYFFIAIKFGVYVRMFHWFFTGMLWQYYFWIEVIILMSANAYYVKIRNETK